MKKIILLSTFFFCCLQLNLAQHPGDLDSSFGINGIVTVNFGSNSYTYFTSTATLGDGKILVSGHTSMNQVANYFLIRFNSDGSYDKSFNEDGIQYYDFRIGSLTVQSDGKILAAADTYLNGESHYFLVRFNSDGSFDHTFGKAGIQQNDFVINSLAIQSDGKIVVAGNIVINGDYGPIKPALARYNANGGIDSSFSEDGKQTTEFENSDDPTAFGSLLAIQNDGKIVMSGRKFEYEAEFPYGGYIARYNIDGSLDTLINIGRGIGVQGSVAMGGNNEIAITGNISNRFEESTVRLLILNLNDWSGSFSDVSYIGWDFYKLNIESNGKIIMTGNVIARFNAHGGLDSSFSEDGIQANKAGISATVIAENKLYVMGDNRIARYILEEDIKTSPTVNITSPANGATYAAPATIILSADASDVDGKVKTVSFYNGNTLIFTEDAPPFYRKWLHVPVGDYSITARATDSDGNVTTSSVVHVSVVPNKPPTVKITSPANGASFTALATIILSADASDVDGTVKTVDFYNGSTLIFTEQAPPFYRRWLHVPVGNYSITARATDDKGRVTISDAVNISVVPDIPPMVKITSPANGASLASSATIQLTAEASDIDGTIKTVDFYNGSTLLFTENLFPYSRAWLDVPAGNYSITAIATDNNGKTTTSGTIAISVKAANKSIAAGRNLNYYNKPLSLNVNPNPATNTLNISIEGLQPNTKSTLSVLSASGIVIKTIQSNTLSKNMQMDISSLSAGVYFIKLINGDKVLYKQFVKL